MKKIFTLLWLTIIAFTFKAAAQPGTACNAEFTVQYLSNYTVKFNPAITTDSPLVHHYWNFADGSAINQLISPTHTFTLPGTYPVVHTISRVNPNGVPVCTQSFTRLVTITADCNLVADFSWSSVAATPLTINFQNLSVPLAATDSITWIFGDNSTSHDVNPVHTYANAGTYNVCLIVKKFPSQTNFPCIKYICKTVVVQAPCNLIADFNWTFTPTNPLRIEFHNLSTPLAITDSIRWTFGDGSSSSDVNPVHTYNIAGTYTVCLRIIKYNAAGTTPCIREICKTVVIPQPCNLIVDFNWTITPTNPLRFEFHNLSIPLAATDSTIWSFGDGTSSYDVNPIHNYTNPGTYNVCLIVKKNNNSGSTPPCIRYICKTVVVQAPCNLVVDFNWTVTQTNPLRIELHNLSTPLAAADSTIWNFGDGTTAFDVNPVHTYTNAGTYTICLIVKKYPFTNSNPCIRYSCKTITVTAPCTLVADFNWHPDSINAQKIWFTNTSTPVNTTDSIHWTFGDGASSNLYSPNHTYSQPGTYIVCLRMQSRGPAGTITNCVREICKTITVLPTCNFQANFSWRLDSINQRKVYFTNLSNTTTASAIVTWFFGDGTTASSWNAIHEYAQPGRYNVCLRVEISPNCVRYKCDTITIAIPLPPCNNQSNFNFVSATTNTQTYTFIPAFQNAAAQYTWTFGDGTGSHDMIATHHYAQAGIYTACLTVWRSTTCASTTCREVRVQQQFNCDSARVTFSYQPDPQVPNKIHFFANTNVPILDQTWTITRMPAGGSVVTLHQNNPTYLFQDTGYYRVCLRAITLGGCVREYCSIIRIQQVANACILQVYPNPTSTTINVNVTLTQPEMIHAFIYNTMNILVREKHQQGNTGNNLVSVNVNDLAAGMYNIRLIYGNRTCYARFQKL